MVAVQARRSDPSEVLATALANAGKELGLTRSALAGVIGKDRTTLSRGGIDPHGKAGELALLLIRAYRALFALVGGDAAQMKHWMHTPNRHTGGVPAEQIHTVEGLMTVVHYLDAMRGKV